MAVEVQRQVVLGFEHTILEVDRAHIACGPEGRSLADREMTFLPNTPKRTKLLV